MNMKGSNKSLEEIFALLRQKGLKTPNLNRDTIHSNKVGIEESEKDGRENMKGSNKSLEDILNRDPELYLKLQKNDRDDKMQTEAISFAKSIFEFIKYLTIFICIILVLGCITIKSLPTFLANWTNLKISFEMEEKVMIALVTTLFANSLTCFGIIIKSMFNKNNEKH